MRYPIKSSNVKPLVALPTGTVALAGAGVLPGACLLLPFAARGVASSKMDFLVSFFLLVADDSACMERKAKGSSSSGAAASWTGLLGDSLATRLAGVAFADRAGFASSGGDMVGGGGMLDEVENMSASVGIGGGGGVGKFGTYTPACPNGKVID